MFKDLLKYSSLIILVIFAQSTTANNIDSLKTALRSSKASDKCRLIKEIGIEYINSDLDSAFYYLDSALVLAKAGKLKKEIPHILRSLGKAYMYISYMDEGIEYTKQSIKAYAEINDQYNLGLTYNNLGIFFSYQGDNDSSIIVHRKALKIFKTMKDTVEIIETLNNIGTTYYYKSDYDSALLILNKALKICNKIKVNETIGAVYNNLGLTYHTTGQLELATENYLSALKYFEKTDDIRTINQIYNNIGTLYVELGFNEKAMAYFKRKADQCLESDDIPEFLLAYSNIGLCYFNLGQHDSALYVFERAAAMSENINNDRTKGIVFKNLADSYYVEERYEEALEYLHKAAECRIRDNDKYGLAMVYNTIGNTYTGLKNYKKALDYLSKCETIAKEIDAYKVVVTTNLSIAETYLNMGNYKMAAMYYNQYIAINDSVINESVQSQMSELETKFQTEKKEQQIKLQNAEISAKEKQIEKEQAENEKKAAQRNVFIIGFLLMIVLAFFILRSYRQKKKANEIINEKNRILEQANEEITAQRDEIEAQRDEIEAQRDMVQTQKEQIEEIHMEVSQSIDYAKRIQSSILSDTNILKQNFSDCFVLFKPKDIVSGDFYWWTKIEDTTIVTAADCTGHGVPGAFMSMLGISLIREIVIKEYITHPGVILRRLRKEIINTLKQKGVTGEQKDGMDMSLISIDRKTNKMQFAGANNPLYLIRENELQEIKGDKMPIAIYEKMDNFNTIDIQLQKDDLIYMFSDGYADQFGGPDGKKLKYKTFKQILLENKDKQMSEQKEILLDKFENWKGSLDQVDDVVIVGLKI